MRSKLTSISLATVIIGFLSLTNLASANMLLDNLSDLKIQNFNGQEWKVDHQEEKSMRIDCTSCEKPIFANIQVRARDTFGVLGSEKAEKAKADCLASNGMSLQCDTLEGIDIGNISGISSTLKIIEGVFVASYVLGDDKTLMQISTKASTKDEAGDINKGLFEAIKSEVIVQ